MLYGAQPVHNTLNSGLPGCMGSPRVPYSSCLHLSALLDELQELFVALWPAHLDAFITAKPTCTQPWLSWVPCQLGSQWCLSAEGRVEPAFREMLTVRVCGRERQAAVGNGRSWRTGSTMPGVGQLVMLYSCRSNAWHRRPACKQD